MGWIVYDTQRGDIEKYYKLESSAKSLVTRSNNDRANSSWGYYRDRQLAYCSYRDYEGVLMGLRGDQLKLWQFVNSKNG